MKICKQRRGGYSTPLNGKIICKYCEQEIAAGSQRCPECGKHRLMGKAELRYCGLKIHGEWGDSPVPHNKSGGRGQGADRGRILFDIDSGDYQERSE